MPSFFGQNPPDTEVGSTDATENTIAENATVETDSAGGFYQGSPSQTVVEAFEADAREAATAAEAAKVAAEAAQAAASLSESNAASAAANASSSESAGSTSATNASNSASLAAASATIATTKASEASTSAANSANSAASASSSASAASSSASAASSSASSASSSATSAATSASNAAASESAANTSATNAAASASAASASESAAATSTSTAATYAANAADSQAAALSSAANAAASESAAAISASAAAGSESAAENSASAAANSANSAASSASSATSAQSAAEAALDSFDDRYLGAKASDPTVDNDGNSLIAGALYFDTVNNLMKVYDGSNWLAAYASLSGAMLSINNLSDVNDTSIARSNLGLGSAAEQNTTAFATAAQGSLADSALQVGDNVSVLTNDANYATVSQVNTAVANLVDSSPATLDTLNELAAALGDDPNFATTVSNQIGLKQDAATALTTSTSFGGDVSGTYNAIVVADDSHNHIISNVDGLQTALEAKAPLTGTGASGTWDISINGNAATSTKLATARTVSLTGAVTGSASVDGSANVSIATTATSDPTLTLAGDASGSATFTNLGNATLTVTVADDSHNHIISNVDGLQTALDGKVSDAGDTITGTLEQSYGGTIWSHSEGTVRPVSRLTYSEAGSIGTTGTSITDVYGESDLSAIDNDATFTYAAAWDAVESHGGRLPTLAEVMDGVGTGSGQGYDAEYIWTCTPAGPHHVWVVKGSYTGTSDRQIVDITNASNVYRCRAFFDVSRDGKTVSYEHDGILRIEGNNRAFHDGYHPNADKWTTSRTLTLNGDVSGSVSWDGSANATLTATVADDSHNHIISNVDGLQTALDGKLSLSGGTLTGNLGVGKSPSYRFHVYTTSNIVARFESGDPVVWIDLHDTNSGTYGALLGHDSTALFKIGNQSTTDIKLSLSYAGVLDLSAGYAVAGTTVIDSSRNIDNVPSLTATSATIGGITMRASADRPGLLEILDGGGTYSGIQITDDGGDHWSLMGSTSVFGLYDDHNSDWILLHNQLGGVSLYYAGSKKLSTTSSGVSVTGDVTASGNLYSTYSILGSSIRTSGRGELFLNSSAADGVSEIFFGYGSGYTEGNIRWGISDRGTTTGQFNFYKGPANNAGVFEVVANFSASHTRLNVLGGYDVNGTTVIDSARNLTNIANATVDGTLYVAEHIEHANDTNTYINFPAADDMQLVAGGRQMLRMDEGADPDILQFVVSTTYTDSNGNIVASGNVTAYASDERLKTNVRQIENALDKVKAIRGVHYDWIDEVEELGFHPGRKQDNIGVIAQEIEKVLPQVVTAAPFDQHRSKETDWKFVSRSGKDYKTVDYDKITALLIEAIKEQQIQIDALQAKIEELENGNH